MEENMHDKLKNYFVRRKIFEDFLDNTIFKDKLFLCPSCGFPVFGELDAYEICILCHWEDDGQHDDEADLVWGGPNGRLSLTDSRLEFEEEYQKYSQEHHRSIISDPKKIQERLNKFESDLMKIIDNDFSYGYQLYDRFNDSRKYFMELLSEATNIYAE